MQFIKVEDVSPEEIKFSKVKSQRGRRFINVYYNKKNLGLKFPSLRLPFNTRLNQFGQLEVSVSLVKGSELLDRIKKIDDFMKKSCQVEGWFPGSASANYSPMLKESTSGDYAPTVKVKIPLDENKNVKTKFFNYEKDKIAVTKPEDVSDELKKGTCIQIAAECVGVWFMDNRYGLSWKAEQIRILQKSDTQNLDASEDYSFYSSDNSSDLSLLISDDED